jgi:hypothetical protein
LHLLSLSISTSGIGKTEKKAREKKICTKICIPSFSEAVILDPDECWVLFHGKLA